MRVHISPINFGGENATHFSAENHRITRNNVVSAIVFWADDGRRLTQRDATLTTQQYLDWCALAVDADEDNWLTLAHAANVGVEVVGSPAPVATTWRVSRDTIWNRVKAVIGADAALAVLQAMPETLRLDWLSNEWYWSNNAQVRAMIASITHEVVDEETQATSIVALNPDTILAQDPYL